MTVVEACSVNEINLAHGKLIVHKNESVFTAGEQPWRMWIWKKEGKYEKSKVSFKGKDQVHKFNTTEKIHSNLKIIMIPIFKDVGGSNVRKTNMWILQRHAFARLTKKGGISIKKNTKNSLWSIWHQIPDVF